MKRILVGIVIADPYYDSYSSRGNTPAVESWGLPCPRMQEEEQEEILTGDPVCVAASAKGMRESMPEANQTGSTASYQAAMG